MFLIAASPGPEPLIASCLHVDLYVLFLSHLLTLIGSDVHTPHALLKRPPLELTFSFFSLPGI